MACQLEQGVAKRTLELPSRDFTVLLGQSESSLFGDFIQLAEKGRAIGDCDVKSQSGRPQQGSNVLAQPFERQQTPRVWSVQWRRLQALNQR